MFILTTTSICVFLLTTLPVAIYRITSPRQKNISTEFLTIITIWASLTWLQSLNYAVRIHLSLCYFQYFLFTVEFLQSLSDIKLISQRIQTTNNISMYQTIPRNSCTQISNSRTSYRPSATKILIIFTNFS